MPSLILKTRLEALRSNLSDVRDVMILARRRGQEFEDLRELLFGKDGVRELAAKLKKDISKAKVDLDDDDLKEAGPVIEAMNELTDAQNWLTMLTGKLVECQKKLDLLLGGRVELSSRRIQERLPDKAESRIGEVDVLLDDTVKKTSSEIWAGEQLLSKQSEPLFAEYVDLLRGLALRETGIERGICELADRLLDGCDRIAGAPWRSLAIPSLRGPSELTPAQIIRLGFPEWTIWALPLAAYEFGRILVNQDQDLKARIDAAADGETGPRSRTVLIDAFADAVGTYAVGPAYACAAILMRLNPRPLASGSPTDDLRAQVIFEVLKQADKSAGVAVSFATVQGPLEQAWSDAVGEAGAQPVTDPLPQELATFFWRWAERSYVTAKYQPQAWQKAERLRDLISKRLKGTPLAPEDQNALSAGLGDVRDILNAAWMSRLERLGEPDAVAREAQAVWAEAHSLPEKVTRFGPGRQRSGRTS